MAWYNYRDPSVIYSARHEELISPFWADHDYRDMDERFICAMKRAGYSVTQPSSRPGTRAPRCGYERPDSLPLP
jgi:hypothetical protein